MPYVSLYLIVFGANLLIAFMVAVFIPAFRPYLDQEDSLVENLTAFFFLVTFIVGLTLLARADKNRLGFATITALGLLGFLDEQSFGERLFELDMPFVYGVQIDAAHDLLALAYKIAFDAMRAFPVFTVIVIAACVIAPALLVWRHKNKIAWALAHSAHRQTFTLALVFVALIGVSQIIDLGIVEITALFYAEEMFELNAAIALLFCAMSLRSETR